RVAGSVPNARWFEWSSEPTGGTRALFVQPVPPDARVTFDFQIDGTRAADRVFIGPHRTKPNSLPIAIDPREADCGPFDGQLLRPAEAGFYVRLHRPAGGSRRTAKATDLDEQTLRQLRLLGYLR